MFPTKIQKKLPGRDFGTQRKCPENTENTPNACIFGALGVFLVFSGYFGVNLGVQDFGPGGIFFRGNSGSGNLGSL